LLNPEGLEFHSLLSFIKGGLVYSDWITTVSPTYATEIQTPEFGYGLEGLLTHRNPVLSGILNGIDLEHWNPAGDPLIARNYTPKTLNAKKANKTELQKRFSLPATDQIPLFGLIGRLVEQKGIDMILDSLTAILEMPLQIVLLGSGEKSMERKLMNYAHLYPEKIAVTIGYDEALAHLIEAGADVFLMPSRFEPCGLNQMYSQRYGTLPLVRRTGGLADTVVDAVPQTLADNSATGIVFDEATPGSLLEAIKRAAILYGNTKAWEQMQINGMNKDFSWEQSARQYLDLYQNL
jgi:starch synthase